MKDIDANLAILKSLKNLGIRLSLDDFGTGYSSLSYLRQFPFDILKIDKSFITDMTVNITSIAIVESIISLAKTLKLTLIAEGIENENQLYMLKKMKCDMGQGYLYSKPIPAEQFKELFLASARQHVADPSHYYFTRLAHEHAQKVISLISQVFCDHEPMAAYLGVRAEAFYPFAKIIVEKAINEGLSMVALDGDHVCACAIVEDMANPLDMKMDLDPRFKMIFSLLENLGRGFFENQIIDKDRVAYLFMTALDEKYFSQHLARKINFETIKLARARHFDLMCVESKHSSSKRLLTRSCKYRDYVYNGEKPFANLDGEVSAYIWELRQGARLNYQIKTN